LKTLRYFDRLIIQGKRMVLKIGHEDPCNYHGHEEVLGFLNLYCNDREVKEDAFIWTPKTVRDLEHISGCSHCMARVFSVPDNHLSAVANQVVSRAS